MDRFWSKVEKGGPHDCWLWTAAVFRLRASSVCDPKVARYGQFYDNERRRPVQAHRFAYQLCHGPIPDGMCVLHTCDTPACVNPAHLTLGTRADNAREERERQRRRRKLTDEQVREIKRRIGTTYQKDLAAEFGVSPSEIKRIKRGENYAHVT